VLAARAARIMALVLGSGTIPPDDVTEGLTAPSVENVEDDVVCAFTPLRS
jgi:hypothetical protein